MKTIHVLIAAAAFAMAPLAAQAQSAPTTTEPTEATEATDATGEADIAEAPRTGEVDSTSSDVGKTGTGTGTTDVGSTGTGTGTQNVGSTGTGTGTVTQSMPPYQPALTLTAKSATLRTPGTMQVTATLEADASLDPAQARSISLPIASSNTHCTAPASVTVAWTSADGGTASFPVACTKAGGQTVTISSDTASVSFTTK
jgi:hypothetical protein